jgi:acyl carrier protein
MSMSPLDQLIVLLPDHVRTALSEKSLDEVRSCDNFVDLGLSSLDTIDFYIAIESYLGSSFDAYEHRGLTFDELAQCVDRERKSAAQAEK